mmetsp:Transcript_25722/g.42195  ORF Transcript_25722/g.42195 Transcript_25722/m.42195 type:complete len:737 (+) Transcript_25722:103-2313(+)
MGKNKRKRSTSTSTAAAWKPVSVALASSQQDAASAVVNANHDEDRKEAEHDWTRNHYDDPKLAKRAGDLQMNPGEDCAIFLGLEVLDASQYQLVGTGSSKRLVITGGGDEEGAKSKTSVSDEIRKEAGEDSTTDGPSKKKRKSKNNESQDNGEEPSPRVAKNDNVNDGSVASKPGKKSKEKKWEKNISSVSGNQSQNQKEKENGDKQSKEGSPTTSVPESPADKKEQVISPDQLAEIQSSWSEASGGAHIHTRLLESLYRLGFTTPTPIQAATLSASIMGRRNLVGAAPTGSGKTLAFLIPILNHILEQKDNDSDNKSNGAIQSLIITPTRELATQIHAECDKLLPNQCVTLVGGIALVKQVRLLKTKKPPIVIATPGRFWAMLSSGDHEHLRDLSQVRFLVLDEADRLTQEHSFPQLVKILDAVHLANPRDDEEGSDNDDDSDDEEEEDSRLLGLPGIRGEAHLTMLTDDILERIEAQKASTDPVSMEIPDKDYPEETSDDDNESNGLQDEIPQEWIPKDKVHRQTFIYSATLTLPFVSTKIKSNSATGKKKKKLGLEGGIAEILEKTRAMGETKVVDLSSSSSAKSSTTSQKGAASGVRLPPGLSLVQIKCTQRHKDSHLYAYLMTTAQGASGPCLVFCNSIAAVRRVGATLQALGFAVRILHAHMQQRARFKAVESLKDAKSRAVVVCTDVAARGLDIPSVSTVVHYDVARSVDTFVHRSGRTAVSVALCDFK